MTRAMDHLNVFLLEGTSEPSLLHLSETFKLYEESHAEGK